MDCAGANDWAKESKLVVFLARVVITSKYIKKILVTLLLIHGVDIMTTI